MTSKGVSNLQIEDAIANTGDDDLTNNFVGVFPSNYMKGTIHY